MSAIQAARFRIVRAFPGPGLDDPFPFGKHSKAGESYGSLVKGKPGYFMWLSEQQWLASWPGVNKFIAVYWDEIREALNDHPGSYHHERKR